MHYSFLLLCYNNWSLTKNAITSLIDSLNTSYYKKGVELIIVNNGSQDETLHETLIIENKYKDLLQIKTIHNKKNLGYPAGINSGLEHCNGEIVTVLSNDLVFPENWFDGLVKAVKSDTSIGAAVPYLTYASGPQHTGANFKDLKEMKEYAREFMDNSTEEAIYLNRVIGACMVFRKSVIELVGGNDFWFGIGNYDDDDWSLRIRMAGLKLALVRNSFVHHLGSKTLKKDKDFYKLTIKYNKQKFKTKWDLSSLNKEARENIIKETSFDHKKHFYPYKIDQFEDPYNKTINKGGVQKVLFVADWSCPSQEWKEKIKEIQVLDFDRIKIFFWVPCNYYNSVEQQIAIKEMLTNTNVEFITKIVPHVELLKFLSDFDTFIKLEQDYINRYLNYLAQYLKMNII